MRDAPGLACTEVRPLPMDRKAGESLRGLVLRLAEAEGCNSDQMRDWLGLPRGGAPLPGPAPFAAELARREEAEFEKMGLQYGDRVWVAGALLPASMSVGHRMQVCPACLAEDAYHRSVWELGFLDVCPHHKVRLVDRCPDGRCGTKLTWSRWKLADCACGTSLAAPSGQPAPGSCLGAALLYRGLGLPVEGAELPEPFRGLAFGELLELMGFLGRMELVVGRGNPYGLKGSAMSLDMRVLDAGAATMLRWPGAFDEMAELVGLSRAGMPGFRRFGYLHRFVAASGDRPFAPLLRDAYRRLLLSTGACDPDALPAFLAPLRDDTGRVTAGEAVRMLGLSPALVARLRTTSLWAGIDRATVCRGGTRLLPRAGVEALAVRVRDLITFREADRLLGLRKGNGSGKVSRLVEGGLLEAFPFNKGREAHWLSVERGAVTSLMAVIDGHVTTAPPAEPVTFSGALVLASHQNAPVEPLTALFRLLLDGGLRGFVADGRATGLGRLTFEQGQVERCVRAMVGTSRPDTVPMDEAARMLRLRTPTIHALLGLGLLPPATRRGKAFLLERAAVDGFWSRFDSSGRIASRHSTKSRLVEEILSGKGVMPAAIVSAGGRRGMAFYRLPIAFDPGNAFDHGC